MTNNHQHDQHGSGQHHMLSAAIALRVFVALLILSVVTVWAARQDFGVLNFPIAMLIATVKAFLVMLFFMGQKYESNDNRTFFFGSFIFLLIFVLFVGFDIYERQPGWKVVDLNTIVPASALAAGSSGGTIKKPWTSTPELVSKGKGVYAANCVACHGAEGKGDGVAAAGFNPKPRNFAQGAGWTKARKPSAIFDVVTHGLAGTNMAGFNGLPVDDRWAVAHFVLSLGPAPEADSDADFKAVGVDPSQEFAGGGAKAPSIPVDLAIDLMSEEAAKK